MSRSFPDKSLALLVGVLALVTRYRRANQETRLQLKWVGFAIGLFAVEGAGLALIPETTVVAGVTIGDLVWMAFILTLPAVPIAAGIAILRYRLYDIDIIIRRTLVYGVLTGILGAGYVATVILLQAILGSFTSGGQLEIAIATLLAAAAFRPLRDRIQRVIDRALLPAQVRRHPDDRCLRLAPARRGRARGDCFRSRGRGHADRGSENDDPMDENRDADGTHNGRPMSRLPSGAQLGSMSS